MHSSTRQALLLISFIVSSLSISLAIHRTAWSQWTEFRGGHLQGVADKHELATEWSESRNLLWSVELSGRGNSSPVVMRHDVFLTSQDNDDNLWVDAVDVESGKVRWRKKVGQGAISGSAPERLFAHRHNAATPTPATDGENVYAFFGNGVFVCLDYRGQEIWRRNLVTDYGKLEFSFGMASSPCQFGDGLVLQCIQKNSPYLVYLNPQTGITWSKIPRDYYAKGDGRDSYSTPAVYHATVPILIVSGADTADTFRLYSKRLSRSHQTFAERISLKIDGDHGRIIVSPTVANGKVVLTTANPLGGGIGRMSMYSLTSQGTAKRLWTYQKYTPDSSTPVIYRNRIYMVRDDGIASCLNFNDGELVWRKRIGKGPFHSSVVAGDGKVYFLSRDGACHVIATDDEGTQLAENQLPGNFYSTFAISRGVIYARSETKLFAIGLTKPQ